jgi:hypothetical protein
VLSKCNLYRYSTYARSPLETANEVKYGIPGVPNYHYEHCALRLATLNKGGTLMGCKHTGYDREIDGKIRRLVTPTFENSNNWTAPLLSFSMGKALPAYYMWWEKAPVGKWRKLQWVPPAAQDHYKFDESPAYPDTLFIGGLTGTHSFSYAMSTYSAELYLGFNGRRDLIAWEYKWTNPAESVAAGGPPALPGSNPSKYILGRWREPQLPWSSPRNFVPEAVDQTAAAGKVTAAAQGAWDAPNVFDYHSAPASRRQFTVSAYVHFNNGNTPVRQNRAEGLPHHVSHESGSSGLSAINWGNYFDDADAAVTAGNVWHLGKEFKRFNATTWTTELRDSGSGSWSNMEVTSWRGSASYHSICNRVYNPSTYNTAKYNASTFAGQYFAAGDAPCPRWGSAR